jgi:hypothetical protein
MSGLAFCWPKLNAVLFGLMLISCAEVAHQSVSVAAESDSVFSVVRDKSDDSWRPVFGCSPAGKNRESFDVALIEFDDEGKPFSNQLDIALGCVQQVNRDNPHTGLITVVFVHGWRHDATWDYQQWVGDQNLKEFQDVLKRLAYREAERPGGARRVFGVYLGWPGAAFRFPTLPSVVQNLIDISQADLITFYNRYDAASYIGHSSGFQNAISRLITVTRSSNEESIIIFAGHSMGALMLESAFADLVPKLLSDDTGFVTVSRGCTNFTGVRTLDSLPDLVLLLNSAGDSELSQSIIENLGQKVIKKVECPNTSQFPAFVAPIFVSATSVADLATKIALRIFKPGRIAVGHKQALWTHSLRPGPESVYPGGTGWMCPPVRAVSDFGQSWHCLRLPHVISGEQKLSRIAVDLPRTDKPRNNCHERYVLEQLPGYMNSAQPFWVVQLPGDLVGGHNDIFNHRAGLLMMAFTQIAGATMSLWTDYNQTFEGAGDETCSFN